MVYHFKLCPLLDGVFGMVNLPYLKSCGFASELMTIVIGSETYMVCYSCKTPHAKIVLKNAMSIKIAVSSADNRSPNLLVATQSTISYSENRIAYSSRIS